MDLILNADVQNVKRRPFHFVEETPRCRQENCPFVSGPVLSTAPCPVLSRNLISRDMSASMTDDNHVPAHFIQPAAVTETLFSASVDMHYSYVSVSTFANDISAII
jgi:hypothetical protein